MLYLENYFLISSFLAMFSVDDKQGIVVSAVVFSTGAIVLLISLVVQNAKRKGKLKKADKLKREQMKKFSEQVNFQQQNVEHSFEDENARLKRMMPEIPVQSQVSVSRAPFQGDANMTVNNQPQIQMQKNNTNSIQINNGQAASNTLGTNQGVVLPSVNTKGTVASEAPKDADEEAQYDIAELVRKRIREIEEEKRKKMANDISGVASNTNNTLPEKSVDKVGVNEKAPSDYNNQISEKTQVKVDENIEKSDVGQTGVIEKNEKLEYDLEYVREVQGKLYNKPRSYTEEKVLKETERERLREELYNKKLQLELMKQRLEKNKELILENEPVKLNDTGLQEEVKPELNVTKDEEKSVEHIEDNKVEVVLDAQAETDDELVEPKETIQEKIEENNLTESKQKIELETGENKVELNDIKLDEDSEKKQEDTNVYQEGKKFSLFDSDDSEVNVEKNTIKEEVLINKPKEREFVKLADEEEETKTAGGSLEIVIPQEVKIEEQRENIKLEENINEKEELELKEENIEQNVQNEEKQKSDEQEIVKEELLKDDNKEVEIAQEKETKNEPEVNMNITQSALKEDFTGRIITNAYGTYTKKVDDNTVLNQIENLFAAIDDDNALDEPLGEIREVIPNKPKKKEEKNIIKEEKKIKVEKNIFDEEKKNKSIVNTKKSNKSIRTNNFEIKRNSTLFDENDMRVSEKVNSMRQREKVKTIVTDLKTADELIDDITSAIPLKVDDVKRPKPEKSRSILDNVNIEDEIIASKINKNNKLMKNTSTDFRKIIVVVSPDNCGKTTVAVNLAYELANRGIKTALFDTDNVKKDIYYFIHKEHMGCLSRLNEFDTREEMAKLGIRVRENLTVFTENKGIEYDINYNKLFKLIEYLHESYEAVIVDVKSTMGQEKTKEILKMASSVLMVVDKRVTTLSRVADKFLKVRGALFDKEVNVVMNMEDGSRGVSKSTIRNSMKRLEYQADGGVKNYSIPVKEIFQVAYDTDSIIKGLIEQLPALIVKDNKIISDIRRIASYYFNK